MNKPQLFLHYGIDPVYAMAFDELLLWQAEQEPGAAFFRLYSWQPGGITIGYNQRKETAVDWLAVGETAVVRRVTGGRALYHDPDELTYAIAINLNGLKHADAASVSKATSQKIAEGIVAFLGATGVSAQFLRAGHRFPDVSDNLHKAPCFASHARHEIVSDTGKIVASAARITPQAFFQHGSIKLHGVAGHPALPLPLSVSQEAYCEDLPRDTFLAFGEPFFGSLSASLGFGTGVLGSISGTAEAFLASRISLIKADPTGKRPPD